MVTQRDSRLLNDFLGSAEIFTSAVNDLMARQLKEVTGTDVTFSQLKLLKMVAATGGYSVSNLAQFLGVSTAAASRAVDRLVKRGLLHREEAADDRRAVQLSLTPEGVKLLERYDQAAEVALQGAFETLTAEQLQETGDLLDRLSLRLVERGNGSDSMCFRCGIHFRDRCLLRQSQDGTCLYHLEKKQRRRQGG
jgi:DNA-binding MarR family transcriptional regulator